MHVARIMFGPVEANGAQGCYPSDICQVIVQPRFLIDDPQGKVAQTMRGRRMVGEHFGGKTTAQYLQLNHYWTHCAGDEDDGTELLEFQKHLARCKYRDFSLETLRAAIQRPVAVPEHPPIVGYIHLAAVNHWRALLDSQLQKCCASGLWDRIAK